MSRKYDEDEAIAQLRKWLAPRRIAAKREPATDTIRVRVFDDDGSVLVDGYGIRLPVDEMDLRTHANNLRAGAGLEELPAQETGFGFFGRPRNQQR